MNQKAFTLAEVLITLGVIGVVAAMTIPVLIAEHQKNVTVTKLQRAISVINQAYRLSYDDNGELSSQASFNIGAQEYFKTYWEPYIKVLTYCQTASACGYSSSSPFISPTGAVVDMGLISVSNRTTFLTMDGFLYIVFVGSGGTGSVSADPLVLVDINGGAKPNKFGRDVFLLYRYGEGKGVQPFGYKYTDDRVKSYCLTGSWGNTCAEYIRRSGWEIPKNYPWK